jgi:hypothetical protein
LLKKSQQKRNNFFFGTGLLKNSPEKKMSVLENYLTITKFLPAKLKENTSGWVIEYYALHPQKNVLQRKQIRIRRIETRYRTKREARAHALEICEILYN